MTEYEFHAYDDNTELVGREDVAKVEHRFEAETLDDIVEKFFWFLRAVGFDYVQGIRVSKGDDSDPVEFGI